MAAKKYSISVWKEHSLHPKVADRRALDWIFVIDSLNFSFWPKPNEEFAIDCHSGYWALCRAINRALDAGIPITDPHFYAEISEQQFREIFASDSGHEMPLFEERLEILRESGRVLLEVSVVMPTQTWARVNSVRALRDGLGWPELARVVSEVGSVSGAKLIKFLVSFKALPRLN